MSYKSTETIFLETSGESQQVLLRFEFELTYLGRSPDDTELELIVIERSLDDGVTYEDVEIPDLVKAYGTVIMNELTDNAHGYVMANNEFEADVEASAGDDANDAMFSDGEDE